MRVTNAQLSEQIKSIDTRVTNIETILMSRPSSNGKGLNPATVFIVKWIVFPLIVIIGSVVGVSTTTLGG